ncbi:MAG: hypothetical protein IJ385_06305 [Ruminiclostridium sp.]|nr:hypothetical protein [Ruminiclostridium sp.]
MLIHKNDKYYVERQDMPNKNWIGDDFYLVDSDSELAEKIRENYPYFEFVLDDNGNLIDVTPTERPEPAEEQLMTLEELNAVVNALLKGEG